MQCSSDYPAIVQASSLTFLATASEGTSDKPRWCPHGIESAGMQNARATEHGFIHLEVKRCCGPGSPRTNLPRGFGALPLKIPMKAMASGALGAGPLPGFPNCRATSMQVQPGKATGKRFQPEIAVWVNPSKAVGVRLPKALGTRKLQCAQNVGH